MAIGNIDFRVFRRLKDGGVGTVATPPAWSRPLVKLWPYDGQSLTWPPREALDDTGLEGLNARFGSALALGGMPQPPKYHVLKLRKPSFQRGQDAPV